MNLHQVLTGAVNSGDHCYAIGSVEGIHFTAYAAGCDIVILASDFQRVQIIPGVLHNNIQVTCLDCCSDVGKIAAAYGTKVCIFEPTPLLHHDSTHKLDYQWCHTGSIQADTEVLTLSWNQDGSRLLTGGEVIHMWHCPLDGTTATESKSTTGGAVEFFIHDGGDSGGTSTPPAGGGVGESVPEWTTLWHCRPSSPVTQLKFSPDRLLFASVGKNDRLVKIWYENKKVELPLMREDCLSPKKHELSYSFVYIAHPRAVTGFSWRGSSKYMPRGSVANLLLTSCRDNICRLWCETLLPEDGLVDVHQLDPAAKPNPLARTQRHRRKFMQRLHHIRHVMHRRKHHANGLPVTPIVGLPSSQSIHDFHKFGVQPNSLSPGFHFHLAASINPDTDIPLLPAMGSGGATVGDTPSYNFVVHWLHNKELQFSAEAERILYSLSHHASDEFHTDTPDGVSIIKGDLSSSRSGGLRTQCKQMSTDSERSATSSIPATVSSSSLSSRAMSTSGHDSTMTNGKGGDALDHQIKLLLRDWHQNADVLFSIHPVDGSFLVWLVDWLDESSPCAYRQPQISFSSRIPHALPLADASTMSPTLLLYPCACGGGAGVQMLTKHENGSLNLWRVGFDESAAAFTTVVSVSHASRSAGHRFQTNHVACHPVLPLLLTTSHHNAPPPGDRPGGGFCSELILWGVESVGPLSQSGGITELARINSPHVSAFSNVAWLPTLLPSASFGQLTSSPSALFVASDGCSLHVYQAVIDARPLLSHHPPPRKASTSSDESPASSPAAQRAGKPHFNIVSLQSTAYPGCIIELNPVQDAKQDWQRIQMIHVFQGELIAGQNSRRPDAATQRREPVVDLQNSAVFEEHFYLVVIERLDSGASLLHMWCIGIASRGADQNDVFSPDVNYYQVDEERAASSYGSNSGQLGSGPSPAARLATAGNAKCASSLSITTRKVCTQQLPMPAGVRVVSATMAAGHLSSSSIYPACFAPYLIATASDDGLARFWRCRVEPPRAAETPGVVDGGRRYDWCEWDMMNNEHDTSAINMPGKPITVSCAYSGRVAIAYRIGTHKQATTPAKFVNLCVAIYECESTGGSEWMLEDTVELKQVQMPTVRSQIDLAVIYDESTESRTKGVPSTSTIQSVRRSLNAAGSGDRLDGLLKREHVVQLDWVTSEDGAHILTVAAGQRLLLYAAVSETARVRWVRLRSVELTTADGLPPLPMHVAWVRDGLLVVGMDNEMHVYSQWRHHGSSAVKDELDGANVSVQKPQQQQQQQQSLLAAPKSTKLSPSMSALMVSTRLTSAASIMNLAMLADRNSRGRHTATPQAAESTDCGLFEEARRACAVLPQYHPRQLLELLNFGRVRRVKAILAHLLRCISGSAATTSGRLRLSSARPRLSTTDASIAPPEDAADYAEIASIPPLPLYALLAADKESTTAPASPMKSPRTAYDSLLSASHVDSDPGDPFDSDDSRSDEDDDDMTSTSRLSSDIHRNYFGPAQSRMLARHLTYTRLPGLERLDQMYLLALADTVANTRLDTAEKHTADVAVRNVMSRLGSDADVSSTEMVDNCALRYILAARHHVYMLNTLPLGQRVQLQRHGLNPAYFVWAFHSDAEEDLLMAIPSYQRGEPQWAELKQFGVCWWLQNINILRRCIEKVAKVTFQAKKDPLDAALFYLAMNKKNVLWGLFRSVNEARMVEFFRHDFTEERWRKAALKNAFSLLGKQRFQHAAAFFLLGGAIRDAIEVCLNKLDDLQLAMMIARLTAGPTEAAMPAQLKRLLLEECLGEVAGHADARHAHPDPFLRSIAFWLMGRHSEALSTLLDVESGSSRRRLSNNNNATDGYLSKPSVFNFYNYLRTHPLLVRRHLAAAASGGTRSGVFLSGFSHGDAAGSLMYVDAITTVERRLYFTTAHAHFRAGCPALALEVLTKLPSVVVDVDRMADTRTGDVSNRGNIASGTIEQFCCSTALQNKMANGVVSSDTANGLDWSTPISHLSPVEKLVFSFDDDSDVDENENTNNTSAASVEKTDSLFAPAAAANQNGSYDIMAQQLKFLACLKLMMQEVSTLATGFEVAGGQLRAQLYSWLECEVEVLARVANYAVHDIGGATAVGVEVTGAAVGEGTTDASESQPLQEDGASLHERIVAEQQDFAAKVMRRRRRRHWLTAHQPLLRCLLGYCSLHGAAGGGVVSVRMELSLLLQELLQPTPPSLHSPLPLPTTLPLLSAAVSVARSVVVDPLGLLTTMARDVLSAVSRLDEPPRMWHNAAQVVALRNIGGALSACLYQCLCDSDSFVVYQPRDTGDVRMEGFTCTKVVYKDSYLMAGAQQRQRSRSVDDVPNSHPSKWPGVKSLQALLVRHRDATQPRLPTLLAEALVAVHCTLLVHALTTYDANLLYRLAAHAPKASIWPVVFGGGVVKRIASANDSHPGYAKAKDETSKARIKLHMRILGQTGSGPALQDDRATYREKFVPPNISLLSYFMAKPSLKSDETSVDYDSSESVSSDEEDDEDEQEAETQKRDSALREHLDPDSYSWCLMRYAIVVFVRHHLRDFLPQVGIEMSELPVCSPLLQAVLRTVDGWADSLAHRLSLFAQPAVDYIPGCFVDANANGPVLHKYQTLLDPKNTPFKSNHYSAMPAKRLWHYLVQQDILHELFIRYIFKRRGVVSQNDSSRTESCDENPEPEDPIKIIHKEQDIISAFCLNQANLNCIALSTHKEVIEMDITGILHPPVWLEDETEYDIERIKSPHPRSYHSSAEDFLVVQTSADKYTMANGHAFPTRPPTAPGAFSAPTQLASGQQTGRGGSVLVKRPLAGVRRMGSHPYLPYYLAGAHDGSVRLWEWGHEHCIAVAKQPGMFPKVTKVLFNAQGNKFGVADSEGCVCLWQVGLSLNMNKPYLKLQCHNKTTSDFVFVGSSSIIASAGHSSESRNVCLWDTLLPPRSTLVQAFQCHQDGCPAIGYAPQHQILVSAGKRGDISILDIRQRQLRHSFQAHDSPVRCMAFDPTEEYFITGAADGEVKVWGLAVHNLIHSFSGEHAKGSIFRNMSSGPTQLYVSPFRKLFSCGADGSMKVRTLPQRELAMLTYHDTNHTDGR